MEPLQDAEGCSFGQLAAGHQQPVDAGEPLLPGENASIDHLGREFAADGPLGQNLGPVGLDHHGREVEGV